MGAASGRPVQTRKRSLHGLILTIMHTRKSAFVKYGQWQWRGLSGADFIELAFHRLVLVELPNSPTFVSREGQPWELIACSVRQRVFPSA
jgi:hypothetical protein